MDLNLFTGLGHAIFLALSYTLLGSGMKYADQAFDIDVFSKKAATFMAIPGAILMGVLMALDASSATIFFAIVLGLALTRKVDNIAFYVGLFLLILTPIIFSKYINIQWFPFVLLLVACLGDEFTNDWSDHKIRKRNIDETMGVENHISLKQQIMETLFQHRIIMKTMMLILVVLGAFKLIYLIAFLAFDTAYKMVEIYSFQLKKYDLEPQLVTQPRMTLA